jgi:hypothetical protein
MYPTIAATYQRGSAAVSGRAEGLADRTVPVAGGAR